MNLGSVLKKERERKRLSPDDVAAHMGIPADQYLEFERGDSPIEEWGPKLARIAIKLKTPTSRLISENGKSGLPGEREGRCGTLIRKNREKRALRREQLAELIPVPVEELVLIEDGQSPLEIYAPYLLRFAEVVELPVFNLFYPCGLPLEKLNDYP